jgi:hypothetical protein
MHAFSLPQGGQRGAGSWLLASCSALTMHCHLWPADVCSGVNPLCLNADLASLTQGSLNPFQSTCSAVPNSNPCGAGLQLAASCMTGVCQAMFGATTPGEERPACRLPPHSLLPFSQHVQP